MTNRKAKALATKIAADLFRNGAGQTGDLLVMVKEHAPDCTRSLGGWCRSAVVSRVYGILTAEAAKAAKVACRGKKLNRKK